MWCRARFPFSPAGKVCSLAPVVFPLNATRCGLLFVTVSEWREESSVGGECSRGKRALETDAKDRKGGGARFASRMQTYNFSKLLAARLDYLG